MHIAVFTENRDGVDLTGRLMAAPGAAAHAFTVITADVNGEVAIRLREIPVRNVFELGDPLHDEEFAQELKARRQTGPRVGKRVRERVRGRVRLADRLHRSDHAANRLGQGVPCCAVLGRIPAHLPSTPQ